MNKAINATLRILCLPIFLAASVAHASDFYLEPRFGLNRGNLPNVGTFTVDNNSTSLGVLAGYNITEKIALEVGYIDLGEIGYRTSTGGSASLFNGNLTSSGTWSGSLKATAKGMPIGVSLTPLDTEKWNVNLRLGYMMIDAKLDAVVVTGSGTYTGGFSVDLEETYLGAGVGYKLTDDMQIRLDALTVKINKADYRINQYGVSLRKSF
jgi:opacity protein-like surface antigen